MHMMQRNGVEICILHALQAQHCIISHKINTEGIVDGHPNKNVNWSLWQRTLTEYIDLPTGFAAISCSPTAFTASMRAPAWLVQGILCWDMTDRSNSAVCLAVACDPSILLKQSISGLSTIGLLLEVAANHEPYDRPLPFLKFVNKVIDKRLHVWHLYFIQKANPEIWSSQKLLWCNFHAIQSCATSSITLNGGTRILTKRGWGSIHV